MAAVGAASLILVATRKVEFALNYCPRSLLMADGQIVADGPTADIPADHELMERHGMDVPPWLPITKSNQ